MLNVHYLDIKTVLLIGELDEVLYTNQPEGYITKGQKSKAWKLNKALYGR